MFCSKSKTNGDNGHRQPQFTHGNLARTLLNVRAFVEASYHPVILLPDCVLTGSSVIATFRELVSSCVSYRCRIADLLWPHSLFFYFLWPLSFFFVFRYIFSPHSAKNRGNWRSQDPIVIPPLRMRVPQIHDRKCGRSSFLFVSFLHIEKCQFLTPYCITAHSPRTSRHRKWENCHNR